MRLSLSVVVAGSIALTVPVRGQTCPDWVDSLHRTGLGGAPNAFVVFDDGSGPTLFAGGYRFALPGSAPAATIVKWDGQHWVPALTFGNQAGSVYTFLVHDDGSGPALFIGGTALIGTSPAASGLVRWDGSTLSNVGSGVQGTVHALAVYDRGDGPHLYIGGVFNTVNGVLTPNIVRWNGSSYSGIGGVVGSTSPGINDLFVHDDGSGPELFVGGLFTAAGGLLVSNIAKWGPSGWSAVGSGVSDAVSDFIEHDFGAGPMLVAGGRFSHAGGAPAAHVASWDGNAWSAVGGGIAGNVSELIAHDDGTGVRLYAGADWFSTFGVRAFDGASWIPLGTGTVAGAVTSFVTFDFGAGAELYVGGSFLTADGIFTPFLAGWDGSAWFAPEPATGLHAVQSSGAVAAQCVFDGALYLAGWFQGAGTTPASSIVRFDGSGFQAIPDLDDNGHVFALTTWDDGTGNQLYAGGSFRSIGGVGPVRGIARWDGTSWSALPEQLWVGPQNQWTVLALATFDDGSGPALYATGQITSMLPGVRGIARWRNGEWSAVGNGFVQNPSSYGYVLHPHDDGNGAALYLGGNQLDFGAFSDSLARWDGSSWSQIGGATSFSVGTFVTALATFDAGDGDALYVGGNFTAAGSTPAEDIARWHNGSWAALGAGVGTSGAVCTLAVHDDGRGEGDALFVGGSFGTAGGAPANSLARWDGATWTALGNGVRSASGGPGNVEHLLSANLGSGRDLFVGGDFEYAGDLLATYFARWPGCGETGETLCYGDGSGTACPCGNASAVGERAGCTHSFGTGGAVRGRGESSLSGDTLALDGSAMTNASVLYFQAGTIVNGGAGSVFGDGLRCGGNPTVRLGTKENSAGASSYPESGDPSISVRGGVLAPGTRYYQARYRNSAAFCTPDSFNYTNALRIVWRS